MIRRRRARAKPLIPVHVLWSTFRVRLEVTPGPCFSNTGVDFKNISNRTTTDELHNAAIVWLSMNLRAHLGDTLLLLGELSNLAGFFDRVRQWLLAVDVEVMIQRK